MLPRNNIHEHYDVVRLYLISVFFDTNTLQGRSCRSRRLAALTSSPP
ncbi:hypothetical protein HMPREF1574_01298 [Gardnerella pickettii JCP7659]|nr:hypothetical protein HMPREF1574_01298 [Gardnerella pickettii JCP7659]